MLKLGSGLAIVAAILVLSGYVFWGFGTSPLFVLGVLILIFVAWRREGQSLLAHRQRRRALYGAVIAVFLIVSALPIASVNAGGQYFLFGMPVTPSPTGECAFFGCHCVVNGSILGVLFGLGYRQFLGCP